VSDSMKKYKVMPDTFFTNPAETYQSLLAEV